MTIKNKEISVYIDKVCIELKNIKRVDMKLVEKIFGEDSYEKLQDLISTEGEDTDISILSHKSEMSDPELTKDEIIQLQEKKEDEIAEQSESFQDYPRSDRCCIYKFEGTKQNSIIFAMIDWAEDSTPGEDLELLGFFQNEEELRKVLKNDYILSS